MLAQLLPFLIEKSQVLLDNIGESVEYVVSREEQGVRHSPVRCANGGLMFDDSVADN